LAKIAFSLGKNYISSWLNLLFLGKTYWLNFSLLAKAISILG
jgi:hypothetical protein